MVMGVVIGMLAGVALGLMRSAGSNVSASDSGVDPILLVYVAGLGFAGLIGGLLRPLLHTLPAQALLNFAAVFVLAAGIMIVVDAPSPTRTAALIATVVTPFLVIVGRGVGAFPRRDDA
jgi:hypothetical protein